MKFSYINLILFLQISSFKKQVYLEDEFRENVIREINWENIARRLNQEIPMNHAEFNQAQIIISQRISLVDRLILNLLINGVISFGILILFLIGRIYELDGVLLFEQTTNGMVYALVFSLIILSYT